MTLTGPGGSGKTRLALEVARELECAWQGAVWFVPLADLSDVGRIVPAIREALGLPATHPEPLQQVVTALRQRPSLLVLDNFEHLVEGGAVPLRRLLDQVAALTCLVTSRRRLDLEGEREVLVGPLPVPAALRVPCSALRVEPPNTERGARSTEHLSAFPGVQLFIDRARGVRAEFRVTPENAEAIAAICARLEGIPLAIELAAARASVLAPGQMLAHLEDRFRFLVSRRRDGEPRHLTLWTALEWSYRLLEPEPRRFFARLSVFRGGWTLAAAQAVCDEPRALDFLEQLREFSMVDGVEQGGEVRFRMLETLREFGREQLAPEERAALERRHAAFFLAMAEAAEPALFGSRQMREFERVEAEHDNLRAALAWSEMTPDGLETALRLSAALWWFWFIRGHLAEGARWIDRALARAAEHGDSPARAKALVGAGGIAWFRGDHAAARGLMEQGVAMWRRLGDPRGLGVALRAFGWVALDQGDLEAARAAGEESWELFRELGDAVHTARSLHFLGRVTYLAGERDAGRALIEESASLCRELGDSLILTWGLETLGKLALDDGNPVAAEALYRECLHLSRDLHALRGVARALEGLGAVAAVKGDPARAVRLFGAAAACRETQGLAILPFIDWRTDHHRHAAAARQALGEAAFSRAWAEGSAWSWEQAVAEAAPAPAANVTSRSGSPIPGEKPDAAPHARVGLFGCGVGARPTPARCPGAAGPAAHRRPACPRRHPLRPQRRLSLAGSSPLLRKPADLLAPLDALALGRHLGAPLPRPSPAHPFLKRFQILSPLIL